MKHLALWSLLLLCIAGLPGIAQQNTAVGDRERIVSLNGAVSEIICALGLERQIVGVDVTSTYPASLKEKPRVGHNRNISAEGVLALNPTTVIGLRSQVTPQLQAQLKSAGIKVVLLEQEFTVQGIRDMLLQTAEVLQGKNSALPVLEKFNREMDALHITPLDKKVLFIYARGAGTMLVSGTGTSVEAIIRLSGAQNAVTAFSDFKPLSAESLVAADPDVIVMFTDGLKSMGGVQGVLKVPGVAQTKAGRDKKIIAMDGELLSGFTLRLPQAIRELHQKIAAQ
jgi:iron complex transport system substrate-binding protein